MWYHLGADAVYSVQCVALISCSLAVIKLLIPLLVPKLGVPIVINERVGSLGRNEPKGRVRRLAVSWSPTKNLRLLQSVYPIRRAMLSLHIIHKMWMESTEIEIRTC